MSKLLRIYEDQPNPKSIAQAVSVLASDGLIIYPNDTVYAIGCSINSKKAIDRLLRLKGWHKDKSRLSFVCSDLSTLSRYVTPLDSATFKLLKRALPGPYTFILPGSNDLPPIFKKRKEVGIRIPDHSIPIALVEALGHPIVTASIKDPDQVIEYTTDPELIAEYWGGDVDLIIDGGMGGNEPSTIIDVTAYPPVVIRQGLGSLEVLWRAYDAKKRPVDAGLFFWVN